MGLVTTWLSGIGLDHALENFKAAGIVTPSALAELEVAHFEALGVKEPNERRKLFYLIQRIKVSVEGQAGETQQEVDAVLSLTQNVSEDDYLQQQQPPAKQKTETRPMKKSHARSTEVMKENDDVHPPKPKSRIGRPTSLPTVANSRSSTLKKPAATVPTNATSNEEDGELEYTAESGDNLSEIPGKKNEDSDWEEDGDSSVIADDEASLRGGRTTRGSRRLQEQRLRLELEGSMADNESTQTDSRETKKVDTTRRGTGRRVNIPSTGRLSLDSQRQSTGRLRSTASLSDADDEASMKGSAQFTQKSDIPAPRRRFESKLQNPNTRTGKALSSIPAGNVAPMSPLLELPLSKLDSDVIAQQKVDQKRKTNSIASVGKRLSFGEASSDTESDRRADRPRDRSTSGSDTDRPSGHQRSGRNSIGTAKPARLSTGSIVGPKTGIGRKSLGGKRSNSSRELGSSSFDNDVNITGKKSSDNKRPNSSREIASSSFDNDVNVFPGRKNLSILGKSVDSGPVFVHGATEDTSWGTQVARLREENQSEHELFHTDTGDDEWDDEEMRIRVLIRKRPKSSSESLDVDIIQPLDYHGYGRVLVYQPKTRVDLTKQVDTFPFAFDNVFGESSTNIEIYNRAVKNLIPGVFEGRWASCFAYGQTGSGKTFTMMGCNVTGINAGTATMDEDNLGLYYMAALDVFSLANEPENRHLTVGASLFEIYGGKLFDLINHRKQIKCLEDSRGKVCFPGLSEHPVSNANDLMEVIEQGAKNRSTGTTSKNADSSRSHAVLQLSLRKTVGKRTNIEHGRLTFIDLAGSERGADTSKASRATRLEGAEINTSLLALKEVIRALATGDSMAHIPFRGSKLTQVLKESFTGKNSRSVMVACIAPNMNNCEHTLNTLRYADRVKGRNSETGALPASLNVGKAQQSTRLSRLSLIPSESIRDTKEASKGQGMNPDPEEDDDGLTDLLDDEQEEGGEPDHELEEFDTHVDDGADFGDETASDLLDELLTESLASPPPKKIAQDRSAAEALIETHRTVMTDMLSMVKNEMVLVNKADGDRDTIDSYLRELELIQEKQVSMITTLHEKLLEYQGYRGATGGVNTENIDIDSDDDSFEDLRD